MSVLITKTSGQDQKMFKLFILSLLLALASARLPVSKKPNYDINLLLKKPGTKEDQRLQCWEGPNSQGDSVVLTDYAPFLSNYNFDNRAQSCCFVGIWLLYDETNYNSNNPNNAAEFDGWGENYCTNFDGNFANRASSVRFTGAPDGYKYSTINIYEHENFAGQEIYFYGNTGGDFPQFPSGYDNFGSSIVISGCDSWTLYQYDGFQGASVCFRPADSSNCYPGFFKTRNDLGGLAGQFSSARRGCFSKNIVKADLEYTMRKRL